MRKIIVFNHVTLDGFFAGPNGELHWSGTGEDEGTGMAREGQDAVDTFLFGRITYDMMASYWPTPGAKAQSPYFADILNNNAKIVFSRTMDTADWQHTRVMKDLRREEILDLKNQPGKNMMIFGSGTIVQQLTAMGLIDEYQFIVNPIVLGVGKPMFGSQNRAKLKLVKSQAFPSGNVLLQYRPESPL